MTRSNGRSVRIACQGADVRDIADLHEFQGDLKSLSTENYEKLKKEIDSTGFAFAVNTWTDPEDGKIYIIGGHQRCRTLSQMRSEGWEVPPVPIVHVEAKDFFEAKRRVIQDISQYGKVEREGLYAFMSQANIDIGDLSSSFDIPEVSLDMDRFSTEFFSDPVQVEAHERGQAQAAQEELAKKLTTRFLVPPFSVLHSSQGYWQDRKRQWMALGIQSELGRGGGE